MTTFKTHPYEQFKNDKSSSEREHLLMLDHFQEKISFEIFKKTPSERAELAIPSK